MHASYVRGHPEYYSAVSERQSLIAKLYKPRAYEGPSQEIVIKGEFGLEVDSEIPEYLDLATKIVDSESGEVTFDITSCSRIWPSALTLLCSLKQWTEITSSQASSRIIKSTSSDFDDVNSFLDGSGFQKYVERAPTNSKYKYNPQLSVPLRRETNKKLIGDREGQVEELLRRLSSLYNDRK